MAEKGLKSNVVGLFGGIMLGISSVAPAYTLTATLGLLTAAVGAQTPLLSPCETARARSMAAAPASAVSDSC